jgi:TIR domain
MVQRQIEALGVDVYLAEQDPKPGTSIAEKVERALVESHAVVVLITTRSINSTYVQQEVGLARAHRKPLIPVVDSRVEKSRLGLLGELEYLELDLSKPTAALAKMTASLRPLLVVQQPQITVTMAATFGAATVGDAILLVGIGLLLGLLIASWGTGTGASGTA